MIAFILWFIIVVVVCLGAFDIWDDMSSENKGACLKTMKIGLIIASIISLVIFIIVSLF